jgi:hypothetical protein
MDLQPRGVSIQIYRKKANFSVSPLSVQTIALSAEYVILKAQHNGGSFCRKPKALRLPHSD